MLIAYEQVMCNVVADVAWVIHCTNYWDSLHCKAYGRTLMLAIILTNGKCRETNTCVLNN